MWRCGKCGAEATTIERILHYTGCACEDESQPHADAAQGGITTNPDGSIAYRHVPIVEEKQK